MDDKLELLDAKKATLNRIEKEISTIDDTNKAKELIETIVKKLEEEKLNEDFNKKESKRFQTLLKSKATKILGGYQSPAYNDPSMSQLVYRDIYRNIYEVLGFEKKDWETFNIKKKHFKYACNAITAYIAPIDYKKQINKINDFFDAFLLEKTTSKYGVRIQKEELYSVYEKYCWLGGYSSTIKILVKNMAFKGYKTVKDFAISENKLVEYFEGITLKS